jgi:hypothetical protein
MWPLLHLWVHQWLRSAIPDSQQPTSPIGFLILKLPPPPCAVLLVFIYTGWRPAIQVKEDADNSSAAREAVEKQDYWHQII